MGVKRFENPKILTFCAESRRIMAVSVSKSPQLNAILVRVKDVCDAKQRTVVMGWQSQVWRDRTCVRCEDSFKRTPEAFVVVFAAIGAVTEVHGVCRKCRQLDDDQILRAGLAYVQRFSPALPNAPL